MPGDGLREGDELSLPPPRSDVSVTVAGMGSGGTTTDSPCPALTVLGPEYSLSESKLACAGKVRCVSVCRVDEPILSR